MAEPNRNDENALWTAVKEFYAVPFRVFAFFMGYFIRNRNRAKAFMAKPRAKALFQGAIALTIAAWVVIGLSAAPEERSRLTDAVMGLWSDTQTLAEEKKRLDAEREQDQHPANTNMETAQ